MKITLRAATGVGAGLAIASAAVACSFLTPVDDLLATDGGAADTAPAPDTGTPDVVLDVQPIDSGPDAGCGTFGPTAGLVGYWPMDEGQGKTVHDCTPNHLDGTFVAVPDGGSTWTQGRVGSAILAGDGAAGCVDIPLPPMLRLMGTFTVSAWMNVDTYPAMGGYGYVVSHNKASPGAGGWRAAVIGPQGVEFAGAWDGGNMTVMGASPAPKTWIHLAVVFRPGAALEMYVNGAVAGVRSNNVPMTFLDDGSNLRLGCRGDSTLPFHGAIDEVRVYDSALSIGDIAALAK